MQWAALKFVHGHEDDRSEIDIDALDGLLSARIYRFKEASDMVRTSPRAFSPVKQHDTRAPVRPLRPKSCSMTSQSNRQARNATIYSSSERPARQLGDSHDVPADSRRLDCQPKQSTRVRRDFAGVEYFVDVCALQPSSNSMSDPFCLHIRAVEVCKDQESSSPMELILNTEQVLLHSDTQLLCIACLSLS